MTLTLRPYQREAIDDLRSRWDAGAYRVPMVLATGLGKSVIASTLTDEWLADNPGRRVLVIAHTVELIDQMAAHMKRSCPGRSVGVVMGDRNSATAQIVVASRQTLASEKRRSRVRNVGMIIIDECHFSVRANTYGKILEHYGAFEDDDGIPPRVVVAGFTATMVRGDKQKLSTIWEDCSFERNILFGIKEGYLLDVKGERIVVEGFDKGNIKVVGGDYSDASAAEELERTFAAETIAKEYLRLAHDRKGLVFWPLVATAEHGARVFNDFGIPSEALSGQTPPAERKRILAALRSGEIQTVHNAMVLTVGFDEPSIEAIVIARPMRSPALYPQTVGRGLRLPPWPGPHRPCLLLDAVGAGEECSLTPGVDLSPERKAEIEELYPDATLSELEELYAEAIEEELEVQRAGASFTFESDEYTGATETKTFDPLQRERIWGRTSAGNYFIRASRFGKGDAFIFIVPSLSGPEGTYDIAGCSVNTGYDQYRDAAPEWLTWFPKLSAMPMDQALLHGEELAGTAYNNRKSSWRNRPPGKDVKIDAWRLGIEVVGKTHGELQDEVFAALADRRIDPLVDKVRGGMQ